MQRQQQLPDEQVNIAVSQMDKLTQANAAGAEEAASASEELSAQSDELRTLVQELQQFAGIKPRSAGAPAQADKAAVKSLVVRSARPPARASQPRTESAKRPQVHLAGANGNGSSHANLFKDF